MKVLVIGPSIDKARGGMATVIKGMEESELLNREYEMDSFPSYMDGNLAIRILYSVYAYLRFLFCYKKYDLFHINVAEKGSVVRKSLYLKKVKKAGKKAVIHIHGAEYLSCYDGMGKRGKLFVDSFMHQADMVLALSDTWKRELEARFRMNMCHTLYNGVDIKACKAAVADVEEYRNVFLLLGRLGARKGVYDLIDGVELAIKKNPELLIYMAGDGEVEHVRELVAKKGLERHIIVPGWINGNEKWEWMKKVSTVVLPSYHEGLPMTILEGMAAGKAIISTPVGAIAEVVEPENGILIQPGDIPALAEALLRCSSDMEMLKGMSCKNREKAEKIFSIGSMHERLAGYYRQMTE